MFATVQAYFKEDGAFCFLKIELFGVNWKV
jgi:hypothetical protein